MLNDRAAASWIGCLLATLLLSLSSHAHAQQRLFALDVSGQVSEVLNFGSFPASLVPVASVAAGAGEEFRGLAYDRATDELLVLSLIGATARLQRLDPVTGQTAPLCTFSAPLAFGLDARGDGSLVMGRSLDRLVLIDRTSCAGDVVDLAMPMALAQTDGGLAVDARGKAALLGADGNSQRADLLDGSTAPFNAAIFTGTTALEVDRDGTVYYGQFDGAMFYDGAALGQSLGSGGAGFAGLAFTEPADGEGMSVVCAGEPNSVGPGGTLEAFGTAEVAAFDLELVGRQLPPGQAGLFVTGCSAGVLPVGDGLLCIAGPVQRFGSVLLVRTSGTVRFRLDGLLIPGGVQILAGETHLFQFWHRDQPATSNLSAALEVVFR
ncbi:MAG: hypothetical protein AAFU73_04890 [Planctomycetota bacterium]